MNTHKKKKGGSNTNIKEIKKKRKKKKKLRRTDYNERFYIYQSNDNISEGFQMLIPLPPNIELKGKSDLAIIIIIFDLYNNNKKILSQCRSFCK